MSAWRPVLPAMPAVGAMIASLGGCALFVSFDDVSLEGGGGSSNDGGGGAGASGGVGPGGEGGEGGAAPVCTLYVSTTGDDASNGRSPSAPVQTIARSLAIAERSSQTEGVCVCRGTYLEPPLVIRKNLSLRGGFGCDTWERSPDTDYPVLEGTQVEPMGNPTTATLTLEDRAVDSSTLVDGFRIIGSKATTVAGFRVAVEVNGQAAPRVEHCYIEGDVSQPDSIFPSVGVLVTTGAHPTLSDVEIQSGPGGFEGPLEPLVPGSAALVVLGASATVDHGWLQAGTTMESSTAGSVGVFGLDSSLALSDVHVEGGDSVAPGGDLSGSTGIFVQELDGQAALSLSGSVVYAGDGEAAWFSSRGVVALGSAQIELVGNAIHGGQGQGRHAGVALTEVTDAIVSSNMIYGGLSTSNQETRALEVESELGSNILLSHNTLEAGGSASGASLWIGDVVDPLHIRLEHNLFVAEARTAIRFQTGTSLPFAFDSVIANGFLSPQNVVINGPATMTLTELEAPFGGGDNVWLAEACPVSPIDPLCQELAACEDPGCGAFVDYDQGLGAPLVSVIHGLPPGWMLDPASPIVCNQLQDTAATAVLHPRFSDYYGTARDVPPTIGAHEAACRRP